MSEETYLNKFTVYLSLPLRIYLYIHIGLQLCTAYLYKFALVIGHDVTVIASMKQTVAFDTDTETMH